VAALLQRLTPCKERIATIALEYTFTWYWLVDGLQDHGSPRARQRFRLAGKPGLFVGVTCQHHAIK